MKTTTLKFTLVFVFLLTSRFEAAQKMMQFPESPDGEEDPYAPGAPIDDYLLLLVMVGLFLGAYLLIGNKEPQRQ